ncbi:Histone H1.1 [Melipona quadrifasciata]|uniref:Histone H1.1 n=1 Tax=Melipona quadrifasciata TaxID=166423 RepID=A0A0N0BG78_9HYME|nr:Histone H1.1 [Melipona quadrifasciata]
MENKPHVENTALENECGSAKSHRRKPSHPPTSKMVNAAIKELNNHKGSSIQAIKKYIATTYKVDVVKLALFVKRYLKTAISSGTIVQVKGKGATGSFKLSTIKKSESKKIRRIKVPIMKKAKKSVKKDTTMPERKPAASRKPKLRFAKKIDDANKSICKEIQEGQICD